MKTAVTLLRESKGKRTHLITRSRVVAAVQADDMIGICCSCGSESEHNCEGDARNYKCDVCGEMAVFGAEELMFAMGIGV